jgi:hypothetical protein
MAAAKPCSELRRTARAVQALVEQEDGGSSKMVGPALRLASLMAPAMPLRQGGFQRRAWEPCAARAHGGLSRRLRRPPWALAHPPAWHACKVWGAGATFNGWPLLCGAGGEGHRRAKEQAESPGGGGPSAGGGQPGQLPKSPGTHDRWHGKPAAPTSLRQPDGRDAAPLAARAEGRGVRSTAIPPGVHCTVMPAGRAPLSSHKAHTKQSSCRCAAGAAAARAAATGVRMQARLGWGVTP